MNTKRVTGKKGKFIALEGIDGAGKSTHSSWIADHLTRQGISVTATREPGGTPIAERLRTILLDRSEVMTPLAELLIMFAARAEHIEKIIRPALLAGRWVLCDRFTDASYAYQGGGRQLDAADISRLEQMTQNGLRPDLVLLLDAPVEVGLARRHGQDRSGDRFESLDFDFKQRVRAAYLERSRIQNWIKVLDATASIESIQEQIRGHLDTLVLSQRP